MENPMITAMVKGIEDELNKTIDTIIEKKVEEFRMELLTEKNITIGRLLNSIEMSVQPDSRFGEMNINIRLKQYLNSRYGMPGKETVIDGRGW